MAAERRAGRGTDDRSDGGSLARRRRGGSAQDDTGVAGRIERFNRGRDPERLALKYRALRASPFGFFRGTCHLFCDDWRDRRSVAPVRAPVAMSCGDLHWENVGAFKGDNRLSYFDINDFDEACLAPVTFDLARLAASVFVGARDLGLSGGEPARLVKRLVDVYAATLASGKPRWLERSLASGAIGALLTELETRRRTAFLDGRTRLRSGRRTLRIDGVRALAASEAERARAEALVRRYAADQPAPEFFKVRDVARRIAGTSSLGLERYSVLVRGRGDPDGNFLLDLKAQPGSVSARLFAGLQPRWPSEAQRVVDVQRAMQAISPAFLGAVDGFVVRELQPQEDRLTLAAIRGRPRRIGSVLEAMAATLAWDHLRTVGRAGVASWEELVQFGGHRGWRAPLVSYARASARVSARQWREFRR